MSSYYDEEKVPSSGKGDVYVDEHEVDTFAELVAVGEQSLNFCIVTTPVPKLHCRSLP